MHSTPKMCVMTKDKVKNLNTIDNVKGAQD
jgi:hypothetical protein